MRNVFTARTFPWIIFSTLGHFNTKRNKGIKTNRSNNVSHITRTGNEHIPVFRFNCIVLMKIWDFRRIKKKWFIYGVDGGNDDSSIYEYKQGNLCSIKNVSCHVKFS